MWEVAAGGAAAMGLAGVSVRYTWWRRPRRGVPILMYHHVTDRLEGSGQTKLRVSPRRFAQQLDWLLDQGYQAVTLSRALGPRPPDKPVVLTFDDGYANFYRRAWPLLKSRRMSATVFLVTGALGGVNHWDREKKEPTEPLLDRAQILELAAAGVEFGGHTHSHAELAGLEPRRLMLEVTGCQKVLTDLLGGPARTFSYPYGKHDQRALEAVLRAGFTMACTTAPGKARPASDRLSLPRIIVKRSDDMLDFRLKLSRGRSRL
jgi:peptidoglycan/xylan/chitin deacetylase (PgdA/CDA1 family)